MPYSPEKTSGAMVVRVPTALIGIRFNQFEPMMPMKKCHKCHSLTVILMMVQKSGDHHLGCMKPDK